MRIVAALRKQGFEAYFAGGCVRDELLGLHPTDFDIATSATPNQVRNTFPGTHHVGASFGVVLVPINAVNTLTKEPIKSHVEVATFRTEGPYSDKRRPDSVHFADAKADAQRRDFTINALFLDPLKPGPNPLVDGSIIDYVNGQADLENRLLRAVGNPDDRLAEDHLRALRAVRFAARMALAIDPATARAIRTHASELAGVSRERIGDELRRVLLHPTRAIAAALLTWLHLDKPTLGTDAQPPSTTPDPDQPDPDQPDPGRARQLSPALAGLPPMLWPGATIAAPLAAWLLDRQAQPDPGLAARTRASLCLTNDEAEMLEAVLTCTALLQQQWEKLGLAGRKRAAVRPGFVGAILALRTLNPPLAARIEGQIQHLAHQPPGLAPPPLLTGDQLIAQGHKPGPQFKQILDAAYDAQLEGRPATPQTNPNKI